MNWKNEAEEKLAYYPFVKQSIKSLGKELQRLELEFAALRSSGYVVVAGGQNKRSNEDRMMDNLTARNNLSKALEQADIYIQTVDQALGVIDCENRDILESIYLRGKWGSVSELALNLGLERSTLYRKRDEALRKFSMALYGIC